VCGESCAFNDQINIHHSNFHPRNKLVDTPPVSLQQTYFECYQTEASALFDAFGIASGNTSLAVPIVVTMLLPLLYLLLVAIKQVCIVGECV
jgi:hypothetical protein